MTYYSDKPPNRVTQLRKVCKITFLVFAILGGVLFFLYRFELLGGLGLGMSLFSLASLFHVGKDVDRKSEMIDTKMTWFLIGLTFFGLILLLVNHYISGPVFYTGIAASLIFICAITYCVELVLTWSDNVRKEL